MNFKDIENSIKTRLQGKMGNENFPALETESFPQKFDEYLDQFSHPVGAALIAYKGSSFSSTKSLGAVTQEETISFSIILVLRAFQEDETYPIVDSIKMALNGYKIDGCESIIPTKINFLDEDFGVWIYEMEFTLKCMSVQAQESESYPIFKSGSGESNVIPMGATEAS